MLRALREDALDDARQAGGGVAVAAQRQREAQASEQRDARIRRPTHRHVLHGIGHVEAPRRVADAHPQLGLAFALRAAQVHRPQGGRNGHAAHVLGSVTLLGVRGLGEVEEGQRGRVGPQAGPTGRGSTARSGRRPGS